MNPRIQNLHVLHGDFHSIQFPGNFLDHVFTNASDHAFELAQVIQENGVSCVQVVHSFGSRDVDGRERAAFQSYWWESLAQLIVNEEYGFRVDQRLGFLIRARRPDCFPVRVERG